MRSKWVLSFLLAGCFLTSGVGVANAAEYVIDPDHTSIHFRVGHWNFSQVQGRFNRIAGEFTFDPTHPEASKVHVAIDTASIDTNHEGRDKHLRGPTFFNTTKFTDAVFKSTNIHVTGEKTWRLVGDLTLLGVTKPVNLEVVFNGLATHPLSERFSRYRDVIIAGFSAYTSISRSRFSMTAGEGEKGDIAELFIQVEGWRKR